MKSELEIYLKLKNLLIDQDEHRQITRLIEYRSSERGIKRIGTFPSVQGGQHSDDVAVVWIFAKRISARDGFDWGWGLGHDNYHYNIGYHNTEKGRRLYDMVYDYNKAVIKSMFGRGEETIITNVQL